MKNARILIHGIVFLGITFLLSTGCGGDSGKAALKQALADSGAVNAANMKALEEQHKRELEQMYSKCLELNGGDTSKCAKPGTTTTT